MKHWLASAISSAQIVLCVKMMSESDFTLMDNSIEQVKSVVYLGVQISSDLSWEPHIDEEIQGKLQGAPPSHIFIAERVVQHNHSR